MPIPPADLTSRRDSGPRNAAGVRGGHRLRARSFRPDPFVIALACTLILAGFIPPGGWWSEAVHTVTPFLVAMLFFLSGARLSPSAVRHGFSRWKLQVTVLAMSFLLFPLLGFGISHLVQPWMGTTLALGLLFLASLPSVVQSSTLFTAMAGGNVPATVCAAAVSNLVGVVVTPCLMALLASSQLVLDGTTAWKVLLQVLLPFAVGQLLHGILGGWIAAHGRVVKVLDRSGILLIVYGAFGAAVGSGSLLAQGWAAMLLVVAVCAVLLALALIGSWSIGGALHMPREDRITVLFCAAEKSLTTGLPLSALIFPASVAGVVILPVIVYHQMQLFICAVLARRLHQATE